MIPVTQWCCGFWHDETGQDLIEYTLLMTFIVLATFAFIGSGRPMVNAIWGTANSHLETANHTAGGH
jgi:Flp pilus assembly pilin Flp